jgi:hypothetical protein
MLHELVAMERKSFRIASEKVAEDEGVFVVEPLQGMRKVVFEGTGEPICEAHFVTNEAAARGHELFEGAHGGTLGLQGLDPSLTVPRYISF